MRTKIRAIWATRTEFWAAKKTSLKILFLAWLSAIYMKLFWQDWDGYARWAIMIDLVVYFGLPAGFIGDWYDFLKKKGRDDSE